MSIYIHIKGIWHFAERALFALSAGSTIRPADVVEWRAREYKVYENMSVYRLFSGLFLPRTDAAATLDSHVRSTSHASSLNRLTCQHGRRKGHATNVTNLLESYT